jgi:hypothetical protein
VSDFKPGEIVDITIKGARVVGVHHSLTIDIPNPHDGVTGGDARVVDLPIGWDAVTVERVPPAEWPPQPGDLWKEEVDGALWFAQGFGASQMAMLPAHVRGNTDCALPDYVLETFGPLTLVHREGHESLDPATKDCSTPGCGHHRQLHHGKQCVGGNAHEDPCRCDHFRIGGTPVAAVAQAWVEAIDRRTSGGTS